MKEEFDSPFAYLVIENGIMCVTYKEGYLELEGARNVVESRISFSKGKSFPVLVDDRGMSGMSKEARDYLSGNEALKLVSAGAILAKSGYASVLANFFLKVSRPKVPARLFTSREKAMIWLSRYIE